MRLCAANVGETFVDVDDGFGGEAANSGMDVSIGEFDGRWLLFSLEGKVIQPGYYHLTTLVISSLTELGCMPGTLGLIESVISDIQVRGAADAKGLACLSALKCLCVGR